MDAYIKDEIEAVVGRLTKENRLQVKKPVQFKPTERAVARAHEVLAHLPTFRHHDDAMDALFTASEPWTVDRVAAALYILAEHAQFEQETDEHAY